MGDIFYPFKKLRIIHTDKRLSKTDLIKNVGIHYFQRGRYENNLINIAHFPDRNFLLSLPKIMNYEKTYSFIRYSILSECQ